MTSELIGRVIHNYRVQELLGEGGMASVYLAMHERLGRTAAIKVIRIGQFPPDLLENVLRRFEVEARALAALDHPHIVRIFDYGEFEGMPYLVMEHLPGGALSSKTGSPLPYPRAAVLLRPISSALEYAHARGVLHRDVKPSNILFATDSRPVLTDFGIARLTEQTNGTGLTSTGVGIGTPDYMAPEQGMGRPVDGRADVYALGIVLYELVTGRRPFGGTTPMEVIMQHFTAPLPPPDRYVPHLPSIVSTAITRALEKDPKTRYGDMAAFGAALEAMADNNLTVLQATLGKQMEIDAATMVQPPAPMSEATTVQSTFPARPVPRDTGPTLQVPGIPVKSENPPRRTGPPRQPPPAPPAPMPAADQPKLAWAWLAGGALFIVLAAFVGWSLWQSKFGNSSAAVTPPTLVSIPSDTMAAVFHVSNTPAPLPSATNTPIPESTNTPEATPTVPAPTWTPLIIVITATPALNPEQWFPVMPAAASALAPGNIEEVPNAEVAGTDQSMLDLFNTWGRITSYERFYTHPNGCDSPNLYGVYIQVFVFQTPAGANKFYEWAYEGFEVEFINWAGDRAYVFRNTASNDDCTEDRVSLTFVRGSLAGRVRMRGVAGKMTDSQIVDILKLIAATMDGQFINFSK